MKISRNGAFNDANGNEQKGISKGNSPTPGKTGGGSSQGGSVDQVTKSLQGATLAPTKKNSSSKTAGM